MRASSVLSLCLLLSLYIWQTKAVIYAIWTLKGTGFSGYDTTNWQCVGYSFDCTSNPTPNNAQNVGVSLTSSYVTLPVCAAGQDPLQYPTSGSAILWPSITNNGQCYTLYISGTTPVFSAYAAFEPLPSFKIVPGGYDVAVELQTENMIIPSLYVDNSKTLTIAAKSITIGTMYLTRPTTVNFKRARSSASTDGTSSVVLNGTTTVEFTSSAAVPMVWNVNSANGITFAGPFNLTCSLTSDFQLSVYNQSGTTGAVITVTSPSFSITNTKLNLYSVTSGTTSTMTGTAVALNDQVATLNLAGSWSISSSVSVSGSGILDLSAALPSNGFALPSTHTNHTINVAASSTLLATGSFSQVILSSTGSFTVDRQNAAGVMDIKSITGPSTVTLKNGKFRIVGTSAPIQLMSAELTVTGGVGQQISGDAYSTVIVDSANALKAPPVASDGDLRLWNYAYTLLGAFSAGKGVFIEKKSQVDIMGATTLPDATTVDDATLTLDGTFTFGVPIVVQNNGVLNFSPGAILDVTFANVSLLTGGQIINTIDFTPNGNGIFGVKGAKQGEFVSYAPIVVSNYTFTTDQLNLKENTSLTITDSGVVSASTLYAAPSAWVDFAGAIQLTGDFVNDGEVYWGGKETVGNSALTGNYAQNANGTTFVTITSLNDTKPVGKFDTLTVTGDVFVFGTLQLEFADTAAALALPDQAWYPIITLTGASGGVFDKVEHNLGAEVTLKVCFTATQGILVVNHNTTTSTVDFVALPSSCDFVNPVPVAVPSDGGSPSSGPSSTISSAITVAVSYIVLLPSVVVLAIF